LLGAVMKGRPVSSATCTGGVRCVWVGGGVGRGGEAKPRQDRRSGDVREGVVLGAVCHTGHPHAFRILHTSKSKPFYLFAVFR
jgi:hypothetical protein